MASLGDIEGAVAIVSGWWGDSWFGDLNVAVSAPPVVIFASPWQDKGVSVHVHITDAFLDDLVAIFYEGVSYVDRVRVGPTGAHFYDLDDGTYYATSQSSEQAWRVVIVGGVVTITALFPPTGGGQAEPMYGSVC